MSGWHTHDLPDMQTIDTETTQLALATFDLAREDGKPLLLHGIPGTGKGYCALLIAKTHPELQAVRVAVRMGKSDYALGKQLAERLHLVDIPRGASDLLDVLASALATGRWLLVIDEAQFLTHIAAEYLRALSELVPAQVSFLYVGGHRCVDILSKYKGAYRRIEYEVEFPPLDRNTIVAEIPNYHPLWKTTDPDLIGEIYDRLQRSSKDGGVLGRWGKITGTAIILCKRANLDTINLAVAQTAFTTRNTPWPHDSEDYDDLAGDEEGDE